MARALDPLDPELLRLALGEQTRLPSAEEVSELLAEAEMALLKHEPEVSEELIAVGWYLHAVASSKYAFRKYGIERQRAAFQVSGRVFDLLLRTPRLGQLDRLKYCFAAQISYLRSSFDPNAAALHRRLHDEDLDMLDIVHNSNIVALSYGVSLLGMDIKSIINFADVLQKNVRKLELDWEIDSILSTPLGSAAEVAFGVRSIVDFLITGSTDSLIKAREQLQMAIHAGGLVVDQLSQWVAAHLLNLADDLNRSSIWTALPPDIPPSVKKAFAMGQPSILTLWPPQLNLFGDGERGLGNPLTNNAKRLYISMPTSAGKTTIAQLLIAAHLATEPTSVCYVASTRSLCREVQHSLDERLRFLGKETAAALPEGDWLGTPLTDYDPEVEVMTPERLSYLIRTDSGHVLERFGLFIFDEVHLVGEANRGWTLEEDLTYLHYATQGKDHRIILMSAAIGNQNHFVEWMGKDVVHHCSRWRGPRQVHAIWTTDVDWSSPTRELTRSNKFPQRVRYPLYGVFNARISHTGEIYPYKMREPVGELVYKIDQSGAKQRDSNKSTPFYKMLIPAIKHLSKSGPVLVIESTRAGAVRMARAIAESLEPVERPEIQSLIDSIRVRLGLEHPLYQVLQKGVAYHHGALPNEIRALIEEAVSESHLKFLVATTTLTEGVNLPVHSVVISSQGFRSNEGYQEYITGSKLLNAIGRAGRATKETEGTVVLARNTRFNRDDFNRLDPDNLDIRASSMLTSEAALHALATFEELQRTAEDAVFQTTKGEVSDFLSFIWFIAAQLEKIGTLPTQERIQDVLEHSLAWVQLAPDTKERWLAAAALALLRYQETDLSTRLRWATAGTAISSASELEGIARELAAILQITEIPNNPVEVVDLLTGNGRLDRILRLPDSPQRKIYTQRSGQNREEVIIPMRALLHEWVLGFDWVTLADNYFKDVPDIDYRYEQLGDIIYEYFEVYLPWAFGTIIDWTNNILIDRGTESVLPSTIPANVRWGVDSSAAIELMIKGINSRSLALRIARVWQSEERLGDLRSWICSMSITEWQRVFEASTSDIHDILEYVRNPREGVASRIISEEMVEIEVETVVSNHPITDAKIRINDNNMLSQVEIYIGEYLVGKIPSCYQNEISKLINAGMSLSVSFYAISGKGKIRMRIEH